MSRRTLLLGIAPVLLSIAACGGSHHSATLSSSSSATATEPTTTTQSSVSTAPSTTAPSTSTAPTTTSSGGAAVSGVGTTTSSSSGGASPSTTTAPAGGSVHVRVPATFVVRAGGRLNPPSISAPAFLAVQVTVVSRDGRGHRVVLRTPVPHTLSVPAGGRASRLIPGQRAGQYQVEIDGHPGGALLIGGEPGP